VVVSVNMYRFSTVQEKVTELGGWVRVGLGWANIGLFCVRFLIDGVIHAFCLHTPSAQVSFKCFV